MSNTDYNCCPSEKSAKSAIAYMKWCWLKQYYDTDVDWCDGSEKHCIIISEDKIATTIYYGNNEIFAFNTMAGRSRFMSYPENIQLGKDFFMID